jgi:hypothetical protein
MAAPQTFLINVQTHHMSPQRPGYKAGANKVIACYRLILSMRLFETSIGFLNSGNLNVSCLDQLALVQ